MPPSRGQFGCAVIFIATAAPVLFVGYLIVDELRNGFGRRARASVCKEVEEALGGRQGHFRLWDEIERDEFVQQMDRLANVTSFELDLEYGPCPDPFLEQIRGLRGVTSMLVVKTNVTDAGLEHIATLPDLRNLLLCHVNVTDVGLRALQNCPQLETLHLSLYSGDAVSLPDLVATTKVKTLTLDEPYGESWIKDGIDKIETAPNLTELRLYGSDLTADEVEQLRWKLPRCAVRAFRRSAGRDKKEIAPLPDVGDMIR